MKNIFSLFFLAATLMLGFTACEESLSEVNIDKNNPSSVGLNLMLPEVLGQSVFNDGLNPNRVAGIIMQQLSGLDAQQLGYNTYVMGADAMNNYWNTALYSGALRSSKVIIDNSAERPFYGAVAKIVMANELGKATSFWGDMPYSQALQGLEQLKPAYDSQESIYSSVQTLLDEGIKALEDGADGYFGGDLIFGGDASKWIAVAHGLKARYYLHTSKQNNGNYDLAAQEAAKSFTSLADQPVFPFTTSETANWSLAKFGIERPSTLGVSENFAAMMDGDPRRDKIMSYDGTQWVYFDGGEGTLLWGRSDAPVPMISLCELKFIEAEAVARSGGDASDALSSAILANMKMLGLGSAADSTYAATLSQNADVNTVMTEAYKAYFGFNFHEVWTNWRRTGVPALTPAAEGAGGFNPSGAIPQRYLYPESEVQTNRVNVEAAMSAQGGDLLDSKLWAFK